VAVGIVLLTVRIVDRTATNTTPPSQALCTAVTHTPHNNTFANFYRQMPVSGTTSGCKVCTTAKCARWHQHVYCQDKLTIWAWWQYSYEEWWLLGGYAMWPL
jgi:hypothetical protein